MEPMGSDAPDLVSGISQGVSSKTRLENVERLLSECFATLVPSTPKP